MDEYDDEDDEAALIHADEEGDDGDDQDEREALEAAMNEFEAEQGEDGDDDDDDEEGMDDGDENEEEGDEAGEGEGCDDIDDDGGMEVAGGTPATEFMRADDDDDDDDDESDIDDLRIRPTDALVLVATTEEQEHSTLEVHVYEEDTGNLYVHHDITLPAFPLCTAWGNYPPHGITAGEKANVGSYVAVGTFQPGIEIWDLDVIDPLEPVGVLGGEVPPEEVGDKKKKKKKNKNKGPVLKPGSHSDAVMTLSWNREHRQVSGKR